MGEAVFDGEDGRLAARLAATLEPELQDALDHPVRREVLRALNRSEQSRTAAEIGAELRSFRADQVGYHLQVLRRADTVVSEPPPAASNGNGRPRYASKVSEDGQVRAVLRATERRDQERKEAAAAATTSPLLTMFRTPRPVRTIRLRGRERTDRDQGSE